MAGCWAVRTAEAANTIAPESFVANDRFVMLTSPVYRTYSNHK